MKRIFPPIKVKPPARIPIENPRSFKHFNVDAGAVALLYLAWEEDAAHFAREEVMKHEISFEITGAELRAARSQLRWTVRRLSTESGIHRSTISKIEAGKPGWPEIVSGLRRALESAGAIFADQPSPNSAVRLH